MEKLIKIAQKIGKKFMSDNSSEIYTKLSTDKFFRPLCLSLGGNDMVKLIFLIKGYGDGKELTSLGKEIEQKLFTFSIIEVDDTIPDETCDNCGGNGQINCYNCEGLGEIDCGECDGSGTDDEGDSCSYCDDDGKVDCDECEGRGYENCGDCDSSGYIDNEDSANISTKYYSSIEKEVFNNILLLEKFEEIPQNINRFLKLDLFTFCYNTEDDTTYDSDIYTEKGNVIFLEFNDNPEFVLNNGKKLPLIDSGLS